METALQAGNPVPIPPPEQRPEAATEQGDDGGAAAPRRVRRDAAVCRRRPCADAGMWWSRSSTPVTATRCSSTLRPLPGVKPRKVRMPEREQFWLFEVRQSDGEFLRKAGVKPCVIDDPCPRPLPQWLHGEPHARLTEKDTEWLKACGVAWEREPAVQLPLDFCGCQETVQET